ASGATAMAGVYTIHTKEDQSFVEEQLLRALPPLGFDRWITRSLSPSSEMEDATVVLVVVPASASVTQAFCDEVQVALSGSAPVIPVYRGKRNTEPADPVLSMLQHAGCVDAS